jgi:hypothetical protein
MSTVLGTIIAHQAPISHGTDRDKPAISSGLYVCTDLKPMVIWGFILRCRYLILDKRLIFWCLILMHPNSPFSVLPDPFD